MVRNTIQQERKPLRLKEYDYHQNGAYFITICTQNRECRLGDVVNGRMRLNDCGRMVASIWQELPDYYPGIVLDSFVIMPNHVHGIIFINDVSVGAAPRGGPLSTNNNFGPPRGAAPTKKLSLSDLIHRFKSLTTTKYSIGVHAYGWPPFEAKLWQRSYHDHIIRNEDDLMRIRDYIVNNPAQWETDENNPLVGDDLHVVPSQKKGEGPRHIRGGHTGPPLHTVLTLLLFGIMMTCLTGCKPENTQNAVGTLPPQGEPGELVFVNNCAGCHAGGSNSMNPAKPVRGSGKLTDKQTFIAFLRNPSGTMPPYDKAAISDEQAAQLLLYVKKAFH